MPKIKCPFCNTSFEFQGTGTCPSCGAKISVSVKTTSVSASLGDKEGRLADLMKHYEEALARGDNEAAAGFMEEYLRTTVTGMPGFETPEKVEAFVAESMKTFRQGLESGSSDPETSGADDDALLTKDVPDATEETSTETEASSKRGLFDKIKERLKGAVDIEEIIDDAKDAFGG
ncbi:MAG: hypothetical protein ABIM59_02685 [candidate division WOR-3 bacterium]